MRQSGSVFGEAGVARLDWKGFRGGHSRGESSRRRLVRQKQQKRRVEDFRKIYD